MTGKELGVQQIQLAKIALTVMITLELNRGNHNQTSTAKVMSAQIKTTMLTT